MDVSETRRLNLIEHIANNFAGNRAAFSRATGKNPNLINLVLSSNKDYARAIGEKLARDIEIKSNLPKGWMDSPHGIGERNSVFIPMITAVSLPTAQPPGADYSFTLPMDDPRFALRLTGTKNLVIYTGKDSTMAPTIEIGDFLWIDLGVKDYAGDGVYAMTTESGVTIRRLQKISETELRVSTDNKSYESIVAKIKGKGKPEICGRVIACSKTNQL
jgi:SOS-response transcriptional repressor LexA